MQPCVVKPKQISRAVQEKSHRSRDVACPASPAKSGIVRLAQKQKTSGSFLQKRTCLPTRFFKQKPALLRIGSNE
jgi:hypothetical protein